MSNQLYIHPETPINGVCDNHNELPPTDGLFVGHRFIGEELEILVGQKIGSDYRMAVVLNAQDAHLLFTRIQQILEAASRGQSFAYQHPTEFHISQDGVTEGNLS